MKPGKKPNICVPTTQLKLHHYQQCAAPCVAHLIRAPDPSPHTQPLAGILFFLHPYFIVWPYSVCPYNILAVLAFELYKNIKVPCGLFLYLYIVSKITHISV